MEIAYLGGDSLKIKGKNGSVVIDPVSSSKLEADIVAFTTKNPKNLSISVVGSRLSVQGVGEYEVAGIKISSISQGESLVHTIKVDNVTVIVGNAESISKVHDKLSEPHIVASSVNEGSLAEVVTALAPKVAVLFGKNAKAEAKNLGKEEVKAVSKYVTTDTKLPQDLEVVILE